jgi:hypothetical protein
MASDIGRLLIRAGNVLRELDFYNDAERESFLSDLSDGLGEAWRQKLLTWRAGKPASDAELREAREADKIRRGSV